MIISPLSTVVKKKKERKKEEGREERKEGKRKHSLVCHYLGRGFYLSSIITKMNLVPILMDLWSNREAGQGLVIKRLKGNLKSRGPHGNAKRGS